MAARGGRKRRNRPRNRSKRQGYEQRRSEGEMSANPYRDGTFRVSTVKIEEDRNGGGWVLEWEPGCTERHATAADGLNAVKTRDRVLGDAGMSVITTVEWTTHTPVGKVVVKALQGQPKR